MTWNELTEKQKKVAIENLKKISNELRNYSKDIFLQFQSLLEAISNKKEYDIAQQNIKWLNKKFFIHPQEVVELAIANIDYLHSLLTKESIQIERIDLVEIITFIAKHHDIGRSKEIDEKTCQRKKDQPDHAELSCDIILEHSNNNEVLEEIIFAIKNHSTTTGQEAMLKSSKFGKILLSYLKNMDKMANLSVYSEGDGLLKIGEWTNSKIAKSEIISDEVIAEIKAGKVIEINKITTIAEVFFKFISWTNEIEPQFLQTQNSKNIIRNLFQCIETTMQEEIFLPNLSSFAEKAKFNEKLSDIKKFIFNKFGIENDQQKSR